MDNNALQELVKSIVAQAKALKDRHTVEPNALVNYVCIFAQSESEYKELNAAAQTMGKVVKETNSGLLYHITNLETVAGVLRILKIRTPDPTRHELGDADFTVSNYFAFKKECLPRPGFKLIARPEMEMLELMEPNCAVRAYFSNPPVDEQLLGQTQLIPNMNQILKQPSAWIPIVIPLIFFAYVVIHITFFGIVREKDEGTGAHLFQLWLVLEPLLLAYFAATWLPRQPKQALWILALQIVAALLPIAIVFSLKL